MKLFQKKKRRSNKKNWKKNCSIAGKIDGGFIVALIFFPIPCWATSGLFYSLSLNILFGGGSQLSEHRGEEEPITY